MGPRRLPHYAPVWEKNAQATRQSHDEIPRLRNLDDCGVMTGDQGAARITGMTKDGRITRLVLRELRLRASSDARTAAELVATANASNDRAVPLLTSVEDDRDVALLRGLQETAAEDDDRRLMAALAPHIASLRPPQHYRSRVAADSPRAVAYFRLAVTESGINTPAGEGRHPVIGSGHGAANVDLLWIGAPRDSHAGLLVLVGHADGDAFARNNTTLTQWPLPLSTSLGVRVYAGHRA